MKQPEEIADNQDLHIARQNLQGDGVAPDNAKLHDYLYTDSAAITMEELTKEAIVSSVQEDLQDKDDSDQPDGPDTHDKPSSHEVADAKNV